MVIVYLEEGRNSMDCLYHVMNWKMWYKYNGKNESRSTAIYEREKVKKTWQWNKSVLRSKEKKHRLFPIQKICIFTMKEYRKKANVLYAHFLRPWFSFYQILRLRWKQRERVGRWCAARQSAVYKHQIIRNFDSQEFLLRLKLYLREQIFW